MYLYSQVDHLVSLDIIDLKVQFHKGESVLTEISRKFNLEKIQEQLRSQGLETVKIWTDPQKWFGLVLCQVTHH